MRENLNRDDFQSAIDTTLSGLKADPFLTSRVKSHGLNDSKNTKDHQLRAYKGMKLALILLVTLLLAIGTAIAVSPAIRIRVMRLLAEMTPTYTQLQMIPEQELEVPAAWKGTYFPGITPASTEISYLDSNEQVSWVCFSKSGSNTPWLLSYTEYNTDEYVRIDTENAVRHDMTINGHDVVIMEKDDLITAYWQDDLRMMVLQTQYSSMEETAAYVSGIRMIR